MAAKGSPELSAKAGELIPKLHELAVSPLAQDELYAFAIDNVVAALLRVFRCPHHTFVTPDKWVPGFVELLPLRRDKDEMDFVYKELLELLRADEPNITAPPTLLKVLQHLFEQHRQIEPATLEGYLPIIRQKHQAGVFGPDDAIPAFVKALLTLAEKQK